MELRFQAAIFTRPPPAKSPGRTKQTLGARPGYTAKEVPQLQDDVAFGFPIANCEPINSST